MDKAHKTNHPHTQAENQSANMIRTVQGPQSHTNKILLRLALENRPSLLVDCSRAANPYSIKIPRSHRMREVYVVEVEMLYKYRDTIKALPLFLQQTRAKTVIVTATDTLFDYSSSEETRMIKRNAKKRLQYVAKTKNVITHRSAIKIP